MRLLFAAALLAATQSALAQSALPDAVRSMVEAAARSGDQARIDAVVAVAKETNKGAEAQIDRIVADISAARAAEREAKLATAGFLENWTGSGQLGAAIITGDDNSLAVRSASRFLWQLSATSAFTNDTFLFWDDAGTINSTTALTARLFGSLSARLSLNLAWEEQPPLGLEPLDTTSPVTLVYTF